MAKSILQTQKECYLCGGGNTLDEHHIFGAANRKKSEKYGLKVYLCHHSCHIFGKNSVHQNSEINSTLKAEAQKKAMEYYGWSVDDFRNIFGKNYL
jgi:hypothetical protein